MLSKTVLTFPSDFCSRNADSGTKKSEIQIKYQRVFTFKAAHSLWKWHGRMFWCFCCVNPIEFVGFHFRAVSVREKKYIYTTTINRPQLHSLWNWWKNSMPFHLRRLFIGSHFKDPVPHSVFGFCDFLVCSILSLSLVLSIDWKRWGVCERESKNATCLSKKVES